jgi:hypothetical protein
LNEIDGILTLLAVCPPWASRSFSDLQPSIVKGGILVLNNNNQDISPSVGSTFQLQAIKALDELAKVSTPKKLKHSPI